MNKIKFELDPFNRLVLDDSGKKSDLARFRQVIDGRFTVGIGNELSYHVKAPLSADYNIPSQIRFKGKWSLTENHELRLALDRSSKNPFGDTITLKGDIIDVRANALLFAVTTKGREGIASTYVLTLGGSWAADSANRLSFQVEKEGGRPDILTFTGTWSIGRNHQIVYKYETARLIRKKRVTQELLFKGYWDIPGSLRISYVLNAASSSAFNFRTSEALFQGNRIQYELGIGIAKKVRPVARTITLDGTWNVSKDGGITFEVEYENGALHAIAFGAIARLTDRDTVEFALKSEAEHKDIGITVKLSRKLLLGDGEAFIRLLASKEEQALYAGAGWRW